MPRLMSVAFTEQQVRDRTKRVTRRKGWWKDKHGRRLLHPGDIVTLCPKVMGRKPGEPLVRICDVEIVDVRRERLDKIDDAELILEGFPGMDPWTFIITYFWPQKLGPRSMVTRIEWRYLDEAA